MVAVEFGEQRGVDGSYTAKAGCAAAVTKAAQKRNMILLTAGKVDIMIYTMIEMTCRLVCQILLAALGSLVTPSEKRMLSHVIIIIIIIIIITVHCKCMW